MAAGHHKTGCWFLRLFIILNTCVLLCACGNTARQAPVQDRASPAPDKLTHHVVGRGETLYSIAWRYGIDYKMLAKSNGITTSYRIYPGQKIHLNKSVKILARVVEKSRVVKQTAPRSKTKTSRMSELGPACVKTLAVFSV